VPDMLGGLGPWRSRACAKCSRKALGQYRVHHRANRGIIPMESHQLQDINQTLERRGAE
jgi:hypothetical protein